MALAANDPADRCEQMITLVERLTGLLEHETELYRAKKVLEAGDQREETAALAQAYRHECRRIAEQPSLLDGAPPERRAVLRAGVERLTQVTEHHQRVVNAMMSLTEGLVRSVANHVANMRSQSTAYGGDATQQASDAGHAIALNTKA